MKYAPAFQEHIHRYTFAQPYAWKRHVLDLGCKEGYGTSVLSMVAKSVGGVDISKKWLQMAGQVMHWCTSYFFECDLSVDFPKGKWDCITAFEVIEHVDNPELLVKNIAEHLNPNGTLVFSVPHMMPHPEHKTLFDEESIKKLIGAHLEIEEFYIQDKKYLKDTPLYKGLVCYMGVARKHENQV